MSLSIRNVRALIPGGGPPARLPGGGPPAKQPPHIRIPASADPPDAPDVPALPGAAAAPDVPAGGRSLLPYGIAGAVGAGIAGLANWMGGDGDPAPTQAAPPQPAPPQPDPQRPPRATIDSVPDHYRRRMWLNQQAARYGADFARNPALYNDMVAAYDGAGPAGTAHTARAVAARALTDHLDAQSAGQRAVNVQNQARQHNVARQMGVPRGMVMAMEDVQRHAARGDHASAAAAAAMYSQIYGPGFLYGAKNLTDQQMATAKAQAEIKPPQPTVVESVDKGMKQIGAMTPGQGRRAAIESLHQTRLGGDKADPKTVKDAVANHYQPIVREMATRLDKLSPEELSELQQVAGGMSYGAFLRYAGLTDSPDVQRSYQRIFNKNASWAQFGDQYGVGNIVRSLTPWAD